MSDMLGESVYRVGDHLVHSVGEHTEIYTPKYVDWTESDYVNSDLKWCEPMTAHALEDEEIQQEYLNDPNNFIEEKFDGTRGILHFLNGECRVFSRRISKKTNWFTENTDSLPQMRFINIPELEGCLLYTSPSPRDS